MSAFNPTSRTIHPPIEQDDLGTALVSALRRNIGYRLTWDWPIVLVLGLLTAGLLPLIILSLRFNRFATAQMFQLEHVAEWFNSVGQTNRLLEDASELERNQSRWWAGVIRVVIVTIASFVLVSLHLRQAGLSPRSLFSLWTIYLPSTHVWLYSALLAAGYLLCWVALTDFAAQIARSVQRLNQVFAAAGLEPVSVPPPTIRPSAGWSALGLGLLIPGCLWGLPMMLAAGAHRRYINQISQAIRMQIAERIQTLMQREKVPV